MSDTLSGVGDIFGGFGALLGGLSESQGYSEAAKMEQQNAQIEKESGAIKLFLQQRRETQAFGATKAAFAGNGVMSNKAGANYAMMEAHQNGALDLAMIKQQTQINVNADMAEAAQYQAKAASAESGGIFGFFGDVAKGVGLIAGL